MFLQQCYVFWGIHEYIAHTYFGWWGLYHSSLMVIGKMWVISLMWVISFD
jgi:hypothetical protein